MRTAILFLFFLTWCKICFAQNLIANSDFESNGQPLCSGWYDACGNELTFLCSGVTDTLCNLKHRGGSLYNDAPADGGQWCMRVAGFSTSGYIETYITGQFRGVYEFKIWVEKDTFYGAKAQALLYFKYGNIYTGMGGGTLSNVSTDFTWAQRIFRDTIHSITDTIIVRLNGIRSSPVLPGYAVYYDLPEFRIIESWTDITDTEQNTDVKLMPNPFCNQLTFSLADNEPTTVLLYNFLGQQVLQQQFTNSTTLNTEQMQNGIYFYELHNNKGILKTGKVVKQ